MIDNITVNLSALQMSSAPGAITTEVVDVKSICYGIVGSNLLILIAVLIAINFLANFFYKEIDAVKFTLFKRRKTLLWFLPIINYSLLIWIFVYTWNLF